MKLAYGEGLVLAVLVPIVVYLLGFLSLPRTFFLFFLLAGVWTIVSAFAFSKARERIYYVAWGLILASLASYFAIQLQYAVALTILAVIASILLNVATRSNNSARDIKKSPERATSSSV